MMYVCPILTTAVSLALPPHARVRACAKYIAAAAMNLELGPHWLCDYIHPPTLLPQGSGSPRSHTHTTHTHGSFTLHQSIHPSIHLELEPELKALFNYSTGCNAGTGRRGAGQGSLMTSVYAMQHSTAIRTCTTEPGNAARKGTVEVGEKEEGGISVGSGYHLGGLSFGRAHTYHIPLVRADHPAPRSGTQ